MKLSGCLNPEVKGVKFVIQLLLEIVFKSSACGRTFRINHHFNCDSLGVVYLITCMKCDKQYVGSTVTRADPGKNLTVADFVFPPPPENV